MKSVGKCLMSSVVLFFIFITSSMSQGVSSRPIRLLVAYPPGAATDFNARSIASKFGENSGQSIIVENRPGANGIVATSVLNKANPDGHTLMLVDVAHGANPALYAQLPYDTAKDFEAIVMTTRVPMVMLVHPSLPFKNIQQLVVYAKNNPGKLNYGSAGLGSAMFLAAELFKQAAHIDMVQIAYKGGAPALVELVGGQLPTAFLSLVAGMPQANSGRVRALASTGGQRSSAFPDLPTISESGLAGFEFYLWQAMLSPAGLPGSMVKRLNQDLNALLKNPELKERLIQAGNDLMGGSNREATVFIQSEVNRYFGIIKPEMRIH